MQHPLEFVRDKAAIEFKNGTRIPVTGVYIDEGVIPVGATWAMNPIPFIAGTHSGCTNQTSLTNTTRADAKDSAGLPCRSFDPPCRPDEGWSTVPGGSDPTDEPLRAA